MTTDKIVAKDYLNGSKASRNSKMDATKGCAIVCMVLAHSGFLYTHHIYLFHMAVFLMASGYFYSSKNAASVKAAARYTLRKILTLYVPYVLFNGAMLLLTNFFVKLGIATNDPAFLEKGGEGAAWGLVYPWDRQSLIICLKELLQFHFEPQLGGATWFLRALFYVSVAHCWFMWLVEKVRSKGLRNILICTAVAGCCVGAVLVQNGVLQLSIKYKMFFAAYLAYWLGYFVRKYEHLLRYDLPMFLISAALLYVMNNYGGVSINVGAIKTLPFYVMVSMLGWIMLRSAAELLPGYLEKIFALAGRHSMAVMMWHFLAFKLVTLIVLQLRGEDMILLASFPQLEGSSEYLWIIYTIVGTGLPVLLGMAYHKTKGKVFTLIKRKV